MGEVAVIICLAFDRRAPAEGLQAFRNCILDCPFVDRAMEVCGTFDLIVHGHCDSLAEFTENMERVRQPVSEFVTRLETNFVGKITERSPSGARSTTLWLPCKDGHRQVDSSLIDKIVAEGDYMRVYVGKWDCLVHETMESLSRQLADCGFVRLHRSWLVRIGFIDRLVHDEGHWVAQLLDGTSVGVAKSHVQDVLRLMSGESSTAEGSSSELRQLADATSVVNEDLLKSPS